MTGLRVFLFCMGGFALLCVAGFLMLDDAEPEDVPPPRAPSQTPRTVVPQPDRAPEPVVEASLRPPAVPTEVAVQEPVHPLPDPPVVEPDPPRDEDLEGLPPGTLTAPPPEWVAAVDETLEALIRDCLQVEGAEVEGPLTAGVQVDYEADIRDGPAVRNVVLVADDPNGSDDPYLAACLSDSMWDVDFPAIDAPAQFRHRVVIRWPE